MDSAWEKRIRRVVEAESLWSLDSVDVHGYECHGCGIQVYPASYERASNKKRPYFSRRTHVHANDCEVDGRPALVQRAKSGRVGRVEGFPVPFPSRLVLEDRRPTERIREDEDLDRMALQRTRTRAGAGAGTGRYHGHTVTTIRPMCRTFIDFPHDRAELPASIPGCAGTTYANLFRRLSTVRAFEQPRQLSYAPMAWSKPVRTREYGEWKLDAGDWDKERNRRSDNAYRLRVQWATWTHRQRRVVEYETEVCRNEVIRTPQKAWLFFVGTQSADDLTLISVDDHRLICALVGDARI